MNKISLNVNELRIKSYELRKEVIKMISTAGSGHPGGALSSAEIITALFFRVLRYSSSNWQDSTRDRFIMSKGHGCPVLYTALADIGAIPKELLTSLRKLGSPLQGHPDKRFLPVLEASTGSLGQGLSIGIGMTLAAKLDNLFYRTYALLGDGECNEGQVWESAMFASHKKLSNLTVIIDYNRYQLDDRVDKILEIEPFSSKWATFGWFVREVDGHDMQDLLLSFEDTRAVKDKPSVIIARTVKGKGVSFMENNNHFHGVAPTADEAVRALDELDKVIANLKKTSYAR
jgi:transketolase